MHYYQARLIFDLALEHAMTQDKTTPQARCDADKRRCIPDLTCHGEARELTFTASHGEKQMPIKTGSWFVKIPNDHIRISISRGSPRGVSGYRTYRTLAPGPWFNSVSVSEYLTRYEAILAGLDPAKTVSQIEALAGDKTPVLCCFETIAKIETGSRCHRHLVKLWLEHELAIEVLEIGAPTDFDPFVFWKKGGITLPWPTKHVDSAAEVRP